jgi:hypothetical protein
VSGNSAGRRARIYLLSAVVAFTAFTPQPWRFNYAGYAHATVPVAGRELELDLSDQPRKKGHTYCLFSVFRTPDPPGEPVELEIERLGTSSVPLLATAVSAAGTTFRVPHVKDTRSFFAPPGIARLVLPNDAALAVVGSLRYKGVRHDFRSTLTLRHWRKGRRVIQFCV